MSDGQTLNPSSNVRRDLEQMTYPVLSVVT